MLKNDFPVPRYGGRGVRRFLNGGRRFHDIHKADKAGLSFFEQPHKIKHCGYRFCQCPHIQQKCNQHRYVQRASSDKERTEEHREHGQKLRITGHCLIKDCFHLVIEAAAFRVFPVLAEKGFGLICFVPESLDCPDSRKGILQLFVHLRQIRFGLHQPPLHHLVRFNRRNGQNGQRRKDNQRQRHIDADQDYKGAYKLDQRHHNVFRTVVKKLGHAVQVIGSDCHQLAHAVPGMKRKGLLFVMAKQFFPHGCFHFCAHRMAEVSVNHIAGTPDSHQAQKPCTGPKQPARRPLIPVIQNRCCNIAGQQGEQQRCQSAESREKHIRSENYAVRPVIG